MKRLLNSSNFWNALIGGVFSVSAYLITKNEFLSFGVLSLFAGRTVASGVQDYAEAKARLIGTRPDDR